jgi:DNA-binding response OmpR family regulator
MEKHPLILVVDDEEPIRKLLRVNLSLEGYGVVTASDGKRALELLPKYKPDMIILDIMMPSLNGFQVLEMIRQHSDVPVVMLTAREDVLSLPKALNNGADDYVTKPFSMLELTCRIRAHMRRYGHRLPQFRQKEALGAA